MPGRDSGPQCACDAVLQLYESGEEQRVLLVFEEQFARQPEAAFGAKERDVRGAAPDLPAEHKSVRLSGTEPQAERRPPFESAFRVFTGASSRMARAHCSPVRS